MTTVTLRVPDILLLAVEGSAARLTHHCQFALALKLFEFNQLSSGQAAGVCGMSRVDFLMEAGRHGIAVADLSDDEAEMEIQLARQP